MDALERAQQMMLMPMKNLPPTALSYAKFLCSKYGGCGEVFLTAYAVYAQKIEHLPCKDSLYKANETWEEFLETKEKFNGSRSGN